MKREEGGEQFSVSYEPPLGLNLPWGWEGDPALSLRLVRKG